MFSRTANILHAVYQSHTHTLCSQALGSGEKNFSFFRLFVVLETFGDTGDSKSVLQ